MFREAKLCQFAFGKREVPKPAELLHAGVFPPGYTCDGSQLRRALARRGISLAAASDEGAALDPRAF